MSSSSLHIELWFLWSLGSKWPMIVYFSLGYHSQNTYRMELKFVVVLIRYYQHAKFNWNCRWPEEKCADDKAHVWYQRFAGIHFGGNDFLYGSCPIGAKLFSNMRIPKNFSLSHKIERHEMKLNHRDTSTKAFFGNNTLCTISFQNLLLGNHLPW